MNTRRRRYQGQDNTGTPEKFYHAPRGEYGHRYSENMYGDAYRPFNHRYNKMDGEPYVDYRPQRNRRREQDEWEQNPGGGSYGYNHYSRHMETNDRWNNDQDDRSQEDFRARNARYRNRVKGISRRRDTNSDIDRDNVFRERGSVDEHLNRSMRGARYDNW